MLGRIRRLFLGHSWHVHRLECHWWKHALRRGVRAVRDRLGCTTRIQVRYLSCRWWASDVAGSNCVSRRLLPCRELHLNLQLLSFLSWKWLNCSVLASFPLHLSLHAWSPVGCIWIVLGVQGTSQGVMISDWLDLALGYLLDLFAWIRAHSWLGVHSYPTTRCLSGGKVRARQMRCLLFNILCLLRLSQRSGDHVL